MTSPENVGQQFAHLFHGTAHPFKIGDIVRPRYPMVHAFATTDPDKARSRAYDAVSYAWSDAVKDNPELVYSDWEEANPPRVFSVEPIDETEVHEHGHIISKQGFRVTGEVK